ncbi:heme NO-binding domain-containing protein [uncultured Litoreibacter sp.]|uniref:heme NO-binding domain-containing protein n=1 Tax=uncultured Litoreibacter sp. TaxID=1392394 RepID=UPI00260B13B7|nr:heme NO-binding domain-containing protein [uncultured Litoreibacter sp.]
MYGLVHRALQCFAQDIYGEDIWEKVVVEAELPFHEYEAMLPYPDHHLDDALTSLSNLLERSPAQVAEDVGTYLVTHERMETVRRLLRFGGTTYVEFILSLEDVHDRVKLALPDLELPRFEVEVHSETSFSVVLDWSRQGFGEVLLGVLRAMADDYGTLVMLEVGRSFRSGEVLEVVKVELFEVDFTTGREFGLIAGGTAS